jgi:hypothetical protein
MRFIILSTLLLLTACSVTPRFESLDTYFQSKKISEPTIESLPHCHGYGCKYLTVVSLSDKEWKTITKPLKRKAKTPKQERKKIAQSLKNFEKIVGHKTGTSEDIADTFDKRGDFQLDCADESANISLYLKLLENNNKLKFYTTSPPIIRGLGSGSSWLHETAVIKEIKTEQEFAVDAWWKDNGHEPYIIPLDEWLNGWRPDEK